MLPSFAGLIRTGELRDGRIPHALAAQVPASMLKRAFVWPAYAIDRDAGYSGTLPMGALLAIPPSVDVDDLGLSPLGKVVAHAAQDYGVYVVDRGGSGSTILPSTATLTSSGTRATASRHGGRIWRYPRSLQRVTNNSTTNRGGGGTPRCLLGIAPAVAAIGAGSAPTDEAEGS
jgi:hypothetical protein